MDFEPLTCRPRIDDADMFARTVTAPEMDINAPAVEVGKASKCLCPHLTTEVEAAPPGRGEGATALR